MKKLYTKPTLICERFQATEYIAACGESGVTYKFICNASKNYGIDLGGSVYLETNGVDELQPSSDEYLGAYHQCSETHIAESTDNFLEGYFEPSGLIDTSVRKVVIWRGEDGNNIHCTTTLNKSEWETAKS